SARLRGSCRSRKEPSGITCAEVGVRRYRWPCAPETSRLLLTVLSVRRAQGGTEDRCTFAASATATPQIPVDVALAREEASLFFRKRPTEYRIAAQPSQE